MTTSSCAYWTSSRPCRRPCSPSSSPRPWAPASRTRCWHWPCRAYRAQSDWCVARCWASERWNTWNPQSPSTFPRCARSSCTCCPTHLPLHRGGVHERGQPDPDRCGPFLHRPGRAGPDPGVRRDAVRHPVGGHPQPHQSRPRLPVRRALQVRHGQVPPAPDAHRGGAESLRLLLPGERAELNNRRFAPRKCLTARKRRDFECGDCSTAVEFDIMALR